MAAKVYGVVSTKGGVGKSTICANLSSALADMRKRCLLIDGDPQQTISRYFGFKDGVLAPHGLIQLYKTADPTDCISHTQIPNLSVIVNDDPQADTGEIASFLRQSVTHFHHLSAALNKIKDDFDYIFIDTQGAKGVIQESVIAAADVLISPLILNVLDVREFIYGTIPMVEKFLPKPGFPSLTGKPVPPIKVLFNRVKRTANCESIAAELRSQFAAELNPLVSILHTEIPALTVYEEAAGSGIPVHRAEQKRRGASDAAFDIMVRLIHELEPSLSDLKPTWNADAVIEGEGING